MAHRQFISGSPLRTLCLLIAGQPADVFSDSSLSGSFSNNVNLPQQSGQVIFISYIPRLYHILLNSFVGNRLNYIYIY